MTGYFIRCIYVLTADINVNAARIESRAANGGHNVPEEKIRTRYERSLKMIPALIEVCDILHIYDNTQMPERIFKKRKEEFIYFESAYWNREKIANLIGVKW